MKSSVGRYLISRDHVSRPRPRAASACTRLGRYLLDPRPFNTVEVALFERTDALREASQGSASLRGMPDTCDGSLGEPTQVPHPTTFLPTARCSKCGRFVEIHSTEPGGVDVWRLEMHDTLGRTIRTEQDSNPFADALVPDTCAKCDSPELTLRPKGRHVEACCARCGFVWMTGHLNEN